MYNFTTHPKESIKVGQVYTAKDNMRIEVVGFAGNNPVCRMYGVALVPEGYEYTAALGIGTDWKLVQEETDDSPYESPYESKQEIHYCLVIDGEEFDADEIIDDINCSADFDNLEDAMDSKCEDQSVIRVTIDYTFEKIPEENPSFESELENLKKKYGKV